MCGHHAPYRRPTHNIPHKMPGLKIGTIVIITAIMMGISLVFLSEGWHTTGSMDPDRPISTRSNIQHGVTDTRAEFTATVFENELIQFALKQVNIDREKHGVTSVLLGNNLAAQNHTDDMLRLGYHSHWNSEGVKPYVTYTQTGGRGSVGENIAWRFLECPTSNCAPTRLDPIESIEELHYLMMYDDAESDWGHRDNIIDPHHTHVNFGFSYDDDSFYFAQHFEVNIIQWQRVELKDMNLELVGTMPDGLKVDSMAIYEDDSPMALSGKMLDHTPPYSLNYYDPGTLTGMLLKPPTAGSYQECGRGMLLVTDGFWDRDCVKYAVFDRTNDDPGVINVSVDVSKFLTPEKIHTLYIILKNETYDDITATSLTLEYLK